MAATLTLVPLVWLTVFGRHRQIAYRGDWIRAIRRSAWVGIIVSILRKRPQATADDLAELKG